jgi:hypothetical protein
MDAMAVLSTSSALVAVLVSQTLLFAGESRRTAAAVAPIAVLVAVGATGMLPQASPEWLAAGVALSAATMLAEGKYTQPLCITACLSLVPAAVAGSTLLEVAWASVPLSRAAIAGAALLGAALGYAIRSFRRAPLLSDVALLVLLGSIALMSAPTALLGWERAAIAAEGDESTYAALAPGWLVPLGGAFLGGFAWRLWRITRIQQRKKT